jgi:hypothetical protein
MSAWRGVLTMSKTRGDHGATLRLQTSKLSILLLVVQEYEVNGRLKRLKEGRESQFLAPQLVSRKTRLLKEGA